MPNDRWAPPKSNAELERVAQDMRRLLGLGAAERVDIIAAIDRASRVDRFRGLRILILRDEEMGADLARCANVGRHRSAPVIEVGQTTYQSAREGVGRAVMALAHELAHLFLHPISDFQSRSTERRQRAGLRAFENAEHQASYTAAAFLMPICVVSTCRSPEELAERCGVSLQAARIRWKANGGKNEARKIPGAVKHNLARLFLASSSLSSQPPSKIDIEDARAAWNKASHPPVDMNLCLARYRMSVEGVPVKWENFRKNVPGGWYEADGKIHLYESLLRRSG